ncbi:MAG: hypothetical protein HQK87_08240 [Nitrospinae bacterium]|nr:hypothetical protein [Nitrospinota bacterium]
MRRALTLALLLLASPAFADDLAGFDEPARRADVRTAAGDDLEGFESGAPEGDYGWLAAPGKQVSPGSDPAAGSFDVNGSLTLAHWYAPSRNEPRPGEPDWRGTERLRASLRLDAKMELAARWEAIVGAAGYIDEVYQLRGAADYPASTRQTEESELELREGYLRGPLVEGVDLAVGRQIVVWGTSDTLRVVDVVNPLDNRAPGMTDIEDLRLPVGMARLDGYSGDWRLTALYIPEVRIDKSPADGAPFDPFPSVPAPAEQRPDSGEDNAAYAVAAKGVFTGWDLSFHAASYTDRSGRIDLIRGPVGPTPVRVYDRLTMVGMAGDMAAGPWLVKGELARIGGVRFASLPEREFARLDVMVGVEYYGIAQTSVAVEIADRRMLGYEGVMGEGSMGIDEDEWVTALRLSADRLRDRLHLKGVGLLFGLDGAKGSMARLSIGYDVMTATTVTLGYAAYQGGTSPLWSAYDDRDTLFAEIKRSF